MSKDSDACLKHSDAAPKPQHNEHAMIRYCTRCIMPETKPDLTFDEEGVCSACRHFDHRPKIDWAQRRKELDSVLDRFRSSDGHTYDCIVPVSGGKDSTYQVIQLLELGMNPLCVTATTDDLSALGRVNIENLKRLGVDHIEVSVNPNVRRKINKLALEQVGDISWPEHVKIFTIPVRMAAKLGVPLLVWGENPQNEYGGPAAAAEDSVLTRRWLEEFGGLLGLRVSDLIGVDDIDRKHLIQYTYPTDEELAATGVTGIFLGYYIPWDGERNAEIAVEHGFVCFDGPVEGSLVDFENLDNHQTGVHDYFKFLKFGFGRATDQICMKIRRGRLSRADGIALAREHDGKFPATYLGKPLADILSEIDMTVPEFVRICDRFTNKKIFHTDNRRQLIKDADGNLEKINYDNV